ncbi:MAG: hypothetical protein F6J94_19960 [Moorea sp. SIO1F2]|uniref:hypothetical protein n=1 Tax=Moorena sp. SIO1F2 TaxID=2607819 RepID=UPI0013BD1483|nr:hypothetical protein [Moorena sp. SIO1F2]NET84107.1 hypothetical protein [Moorena sp. SIO1F2]
MQPSTCHLQPVTLAFGHATRTTFNLLNLIVAVCKDSLTLTTSIRNLQKAVLALKSGSHPSEKNLKLRTKWA